MKFIRFNLKHLLPFTAGVIFICILTGCSKQNESLTMNSKAKLTKELITDNAKCSSFTNLLSAPSLDSDAIEGIYREAMRAGCINKDI